MACQKASSVSDGAMPRLSWTAVSVMLFSVSAAICSRSDMAFLRPPSALRAIISRACGVEEKASVVAILVSLPTS